MRKTILVLLGGASTILGIWPDPEELPVKLDALHQSDAEALGEDWVEIGSDLADAMVAHIDRLRDEGQSQRTRAAISRFVRPRGKFFKQFFVTDDDMRSFIVTTR